MEHVTVQLVSIVASACGVACYLTWFISSKFSENRSIFYRVMSLHNREDDDRFAELSDDIWRIHLHNAMRDGAELPERKSMPRRRYLADDAQQRGIEA